MNLTNENRSLVKSELRYYFIRLTIFKAHFTRFLVVMSHESSACSVFVLQACFCATRPRPCDQMNPKDASITNVWLSCDVTTKVLVK